MSTTVGIISDVHAHLERLEMALQELHKRGCTHLLCAGDIIGFGRQVSESVSTLQNHHVIACRGNHERWYFGGNDYSLSPVPLSEHLNHEQLHFLRELPAFQRITIDDVTIEIHHGRILDDCNGIMADSNIQPEIETMKTRNIDVLVVGHTHQPFMHQDQDKIIINPGSIHFSGSCAILQLPEMTIEQINFADPLPLGMASH